MEVVIGRLVAESIQGGGERATLLSVHHDLSPYLPARAVAEVCSPTQCIPGTFNTTLGASFSSIILLPGTYSADSAASKLVSLSNPPSTPAGIITSDSSSFPYTVSLSSGALAFGATHYTNGLTLISLSSNLSSPRLPASVAVPPDTAVTFRSPLSQTSLIIFTSVPDTAQLPLAAPDLAFSSVQSTSCSPACGSGGACTVNGTCACAEGFSGSQCEQCAPGFFGPTCQKCQDTCCDDGMTGSGKCLGSKNKTSSDLCGCDKGICGNGGSCTSYALPVSSKMLRVNVKFVLKGVTLALRLQGCAPHAKLIFLRIQTTVQSAFLRPAPPLRLVPTANFLTLRLRLAPRALRYARLVLGPYQFNASHVGPANLWAQGIDALLSVLQGSARHALRPVLLAQSHLFLWFLPPPRSPVPLVFLVSYSHPPNGANVPVRREPLSVPKTDSRAPHAMDPALNVLEKLLFVLLVREVAARSMGNVWVHAQAALSSSDLHQPTRRERPAYHVMPIVLPAQVPVPPNVRPALPLVPSNPQMEDVSRLPLAVGNPFSTRPPDRVGHAMLDARTVREQVDKCVPHAR
ncbi:unnamed protein product [Rhizoctonia solani]|uniref:EGF-like domain-containing protein n=1 Tax=Rhizoctonia solani TaxID=456999 RepID=A0A8H2WGG2_9AGAM|nr:unnamed protein product [Rhizoctonia solani]